MTSLTRSSLPCPHHFLPEFIRQLTSVYLSLQLRVCHFYPLSVSFFLHRLFQLTNSHQDAFWKKKISYAAFFQSPIHVVFSFLSAFSLSFYICRVAQTSRLMSCLAYGSVIYSSLPPKKQTRRANALESLVSEQ